MTHSTAVSRRRRSALVALPLAAGMVALAPLAQAAITGPGSNGIQYTQNTTISLSASARSGPSSLSLVDPNGNARVVDGPKGGQFQSASLSYSFDTGCYPDAACSKGPNPALNGTWTVKLSGGETDSKTLVLKIPPRTPSPVQATLTASREITLTWPVGPEPDLTGWTVVDGSGGGVLRELTRSDCSGNCNVVFTYGADDTGDRSFAVRAHRATCPSCSALLDSPDSSHATATLPPKPPPSPTPSPTPSDTPSAAPSPSDSGTGGSGGGTTGSGTTSGGSGPGPTPAPSTSKGSTGGTVSHSTGGSTGSGTTSTTHSGGSTGSGGNVAIGTGSQVAAVQDARKAFALSFSSFAPKLGIAKLPPLPQAFAPTLAGEGALPDGTYQTNLGYTDQVKREKVTTISQGFNRVSNAVSTAINSAQLMRSIAGALVLMLLAAHLRRWLAQSR